MVEPVPDDRFLAWAAGVGIGFDGHDADACYLTFLRPSKAARFWTLPDDPAAWPHFTASILDGLDDWGVGYVRPHPGRWPSAGDSKSHDELVRDVVLRGAGVPDEWFGAVRFSHDDRPAVLAIMFAYLAFGWCVDDDLFFIPDHGRQLVQTDHHGAIHVTCADDDHRIQELVRHMSGAGYELPREPPDDTFYRPHWMPPPAG